jgi:hypothetical protein
MTQARIICLVGMHRSGTSMIARLLNICGLELGPPEQLLKADKANPLGHFEHRGFLDVDRKLLKYFHASWHHPPDLPASWETDPGLLPLLRRARALAANFSDKKPWGWKEPRASLFLPFWRQAVPNMSFLFCLRNPLEVAESLQKRNRIAIEHGAWLWYLYTLTSLRDTQGCPRQFSFFDDYFARRNEEIARVLDFCGLANFNDATVLESAIAGELRHHQGGDRRLRDEPAVPAQCKDLYFGLRSILAAEETRFDHSNAGNGAAVSSTVDSFIAALTCQAGFEYLSRRQPAAAKSLTGGQRLKKFFNSMRSR